MLITEIDGFIPMEPKLGTYMRSKAIVFSASCYEMQARPLSKNVDTKISSGRTDAFLDRCTNKLGARVIHAETKHVATAATKPVCDKGRHPAAQADYGPMRPVGCNLGPSLAGCQYATPCGVSRGKTPSLGVLSGHEHDNR